MDLAGLDLSERIRHIDVQGRALLDDSLRDPNATVPACPGWDGATLALHIGPVHQFWAWALRERIDDPNAFQLVEPDGDIGSWAHDQRRALCDALRSTPPETPVWTWSHDQTAAFIARWQTVEATIHRVDAADAAGSPFDLEPELAADGINTLLYFGLDDPTAGAAAVQGSVHLHCTDTTGEWIVDRDFRVRSEHVKGDAALRGRAAEILLALFRRRPLDSCEIVGDRSVVERFVAHQDFE